MKVSKQVDKIVSNNTSFLKNKFYPEVAEINRNLLNIYWTLRLHKNPTKSRFSMTPSKFPMKPLPNFATAASKLIYRQMENYNFKP